MEWQAGYVSGAILMPISLLTELVQEAFTAWGAFGSIPRNSAQAADLIARVARRFDVSTDAAAGQTFPVGLPHGWVSGPVAAVGVTGLAFSVPYDTLIGVSADYGSQSYE